MFLHKKGSALLTALFIMTLVAIVATAMTTRLQLDIYRTRLLVTHDKLYLASQAVMFWAFNELANKNNKFSLVNPKGLVRVFPKQLEHLCKGVTISGGLIDMQGKLNLNNLIEKNAQASFINLLKQVHPKTNDSDKASLALTVQDWVSAYDLSRGKDQYTSYYLSQKPPYYPSHQLMKSTSELRLLKEVNPTLNQALQPFIAVLPESTPINVNTASKKVLMSLGDGLKGNQVDELIEARGTKGFISNKRLTPLLQKLNIPLEKVTIDSHYFLSKAIVTNEDLSLTVYVLLKRETDGKGKTSVSVIRQSINVF